MFLKSGGFPSWGAEMLRTLRPDLEQFFEGGSSHLLLQLPEVLVLRDEGNVQLGGGGGDQGGAGVRRYGPNRTTNPLPVTVACSTGSP
mgnify:CR=1 FL=1